MALLVACCFPSSAATAPAKPSYAYQDRWCQGFFGTVAFFRLPPKEFIANVLASRATTSSWSLNRPHRSRYAASVRPPGSQPTKLRRPEPPKLQKGVGEVAVDLPPVQNLGDDLADAAGGQPLLPRDLVIGPALVEPREHALAMRRLPKAVSRFFGAGAAISVPCQSPFPPTDAALAKRANITRTTPIRKKNATLASPGLSLSSRKVASD